MKKLKLKNIFESSLKEEISEDIKEKVKKASSPNTSQQDLYDLAKDDSYFVRSAVASNKNSPPDALYELHKDKWPDIRMFVAQNPNTPKQALIALSNDESVNVRHLVAKNPKTPIDILNKLSYDEESNHYVQSGVAENPNITRDIFDRLRSSKNIYTKGATRRNKTFSNEMKMENVFEAFLSEENKEEPLSQLPSVFADRYQKSRDSYEDGWNDAEDYSYKVEYRLTGLTKKYKDSIKSLFDDYKKKTPIRKPDSRKDYEEGWDEFVANFINKKVGNK